MSLLTEPSPSTEVISFDWINLIESRIHLSVPFQIVVNVTARWILCTIVDEGDFVSILSSTAWKALGSPHLVPTTNQILSFNRIPTPPLGTLPYFPIILGGKNVCIDVMVVQGPLDFNLLLGCDYVYAMKAVVSTLFRVMHFPRNGKINIVTIDQLSFVTPDHNMTPSNQTTLNVLHVLVVPSPFSSFILPIIGKMGGMNLVYGHHNGAKLLAFM